MTATTSAAPARRNARRSNATRPRLQQDSRRAAIYVRISLDQTGEGLGVQRQEEDAREIIESRGWTLAGVYSDNSISASDSRKFRPGYAELQRDYAEGLFDALLVWDLDRLTRQPRQLEDWIDAAEGRGLALVTTNGDADLTTDGGRMYARIKLAVARAEIERKGARHRRALQQHAQAGKAPHGPRLFGYTAEGTVDPKESAIVRDIFERFYGGESLRSLAALLEDQKVPRRSVEVTKNRLDAVLSNGNATDADRAKACAAYEKAVAAKWNTRTVRDMLTNARYAGWAVYQGEIAKDADGQPVRGQWEPLIGEDTFEVVKAKLADPARKTVRTGTDRRYIGSRLYVCATCDGPITTVNGGKYFCSGHVIRVHRYVDEYVLDVVAARLADPKLTELLAAPTDDTKPALEKAKRLRAKLDRLKNDYFAELIDAAEYKEGKERVNVELREIDKKLATRKGGAALGKIAEADDPAQAFREASLMAQRAVIDALVTVKLHRQPRGRLKRDAEGIERIDPATVDIIWKR